MRYNELFTASSGIFSNVFAVDFAAGYSAIFGETDPSTLDAFTYLQYGNRVLLDMVDDTNYKTFVRSVIAVYVDDWEKQAAAMLAEYNITNPTTSTTTRTESSTLNETNTGTDKGAEKAFNDTSFVDNKQTTNDDERSQKEERTITETAKGVGSKSITDEVQKELNLRRVNWRKSIIFALVKDITNSIY